MKLAFLGTPDIAVPPLRALWAAGHEIDVVVTGPDARRGRGKSLSPSPVSVAATALGLRVAHDPEVLLDSDAVLGVVVAFGRILKPHLVAHLPMVNLHFSLLPRWRGAAPVERAILAGDARTGVCLMAVADGLDTGGVYARATTDIADKTLAELWNELTETGSQLLVDWLPTAFADGHLAEPEPQVGEVTYAAKLTADDRRIDLAASPVEQLAVIRLGNAWTLVGDGDNAKRLKILAGHLNPDGELRITEVQPEGRRPMRYEDWLRGTPADQRAGLS